MDYLKSVGCGLMMIVATASLVVGEEFSFPVESNLRAASAKIDISPPVGTPVVGHVRPTDGVGDPIRAGLVIFAAGDVRAAIVTLDLSRAQAELVSELRAAISRRADVPTENILVSSSHNHSGPGWSREDAWSREMVEKIAAAAGEAVQELRPVTLGYSEDSIDWNINRRKTINGRAVFRLNPDGPCDHRVKVLRVDDGRSLEPLAVLMHAVCHPCVYTWGDKYSDPYPQGYPKISADFPGETQTFVETVYGGKTDALFLQGCAGDIRPNLPGVPYRCGDAADVKWTGRGLGCAVVRAADRSVVREERAKRPTIYPIKVASSTIELPGKKETLQCEMMAMRIGPFLLLTIPGEPMVEYGFQMEKIIADRATPIVVGYANGHLGYICTAESHKEGGYEPEMSPLAPEAETLIIAELSRLADLALADVFASFSRRDESRNAKPANKKE